MKMRRNLATVCLTLSCGALLTAANVTVGDQPGVIRMTSGQQSIEPPAIPPAQGSGSASIEGQSAGSGTFSPVPDAGVPSLQGNYAPDMGASSFEGMAIDNGGPIYQQGPAPFTEPTDYSPYMERSAGVTEAPVLGRRPYENPTFGPQLMFESNIDDGLGFNEAYHRANVRLPYHVVPGTSVLLADVSASISNSGQDLYNWGLVWRNYDAMRNRVFGWNVFYDMDDGRGNETWKRVGFGVESLGKYIDFRANGYHVTGDESVLLNDQLVGDLALRGNSVFRIRNQSRDNAYSGGDFEIGGPLPVLGRRGLNLYGGGYYLDSEYGHETVGFSARFEALISESVTANVNYTNDDTFGVNSWVSIAFTIPNYKERAILQPRVVRDRLADPVHRSNRVHSNLDTIDLPEALVNADKGRAYNINYVNPDFVSITNGGDGAGTLEDPWTSFQAAANNNHAGIDVIRIDPRADDSGTNLTVAGGISLFDCQTLLSSTKDYTLFSEDGMDFVIPGVATATDLGPLVSNPSMVPGGSVIRLANENTVFGLRIDGSNSTTTTFGTGITNTLPIQDASIVMNTFTNYETATNLQDVSGDIILDMNTVTGLPGASASGLVLSTGNGTMTNLLVRNNTVASNSTVGIGVTVSPNSTLNADNPSGFDGAGNPVVQATGIVGNTVTDGGQGIVIDGQAGSTSNVLADGNTSTGNTFNGFVARTDAGLFNLSMQNNTFDANLENGAFLHYLNGGMFRAISEDLNGDGVLDAGGDLNGNGILDQGIVSNNMSNNTIAGLCIFGEDDGTGEFDIGGPDSALGNTFAGNNGAGVAVDLQDSAVAQIDALFNNITGGTAEPGLTFVLDFVDPGQAPVTDFFGFQMNTFDVTNFGFAQTDFDLVTNAVLETVQSHYRDIPTQATDPNSPIPAGQELNIDFVIGDSGVAPSNGATDYYVIGLGDTNQNLGGLLGIAGNIGNVRDGQGNGPNTYIDGTTPQVVGGVAASTFTDQFPAIGGLNPPNADTLPEDVPGPRIDPDKSTDWSEVALTSGNLTATRNALASTTSHEIGHTLGLRHIGVNGSDTPNGLNPLMSTGAIDAGIQSVIEPAEFAYSGQNPGEAAGEAPFTVQPVQELVNAVGLRTPGAETRNGFAVTASGNSRLENSVFNQNTIVGASENGIAVNLSDNAVAQTLTIQGNDIRNGGGNGISLHADGNSFIDADSTIGGAGNNTYRNNVFAQGNSLVNNTGDGFRALASNGGTIHGNLINNDILDNTGNGASLLIDNSGTIDFGTPASNRIITGNTISGNGGAGINLFSTVTSTGTGLIEAVVRNNTIADNLGGGIQSQMFGPNLGGNVNNQINLTVGGLETEANTISGNSLFGISYAVAGNGKGNVDIQNSTVSGNAGDGIQLFRADSSLLTANIQNVIASGNSGNGLLADVQGNDKNDPNQPMVGMVNSLAWSNNQFDGNGANGALFRTRGDSMFLADGESNQLNGNALNGILVETSENSSFGDATDGLPPGRRVLWNGFTASNNSEDGIHITATESSRALIEITSNRIPTSSGAHAALNTNGDSNFSNNGSDGIHVDLQGGRSDVLITSGTGQTTLDGNGTGAGGGNGIRYDASGTSDGTLRVVNTVITNSIAGGTEDLALNFNGILDPGEDINGNGRLDSAEDTNNNGILDPGEDINGNGLLDSLEDGNNLDVDVANGDGVQMNVFGNSTATLQVGGVGEANRIQNNADDGIAVTATGFSNNIIESVGLNPEFPRPIISISNNVIGSEFNGVDAGNGGDGVSLNIIGGSADVVQIGADPANIDTNANDGTLSFSDGVQQSGPIVQMAVTDNEISQNGHRGVNLNLNGSAGERDRENGNSTFDPVRISLTGNEISSNASEGIFFRGDSDMNQSRLTYLANFPFVGPPANQRPAGFGFYDPLLPEFQADNIGSVNGNTAFLNQAADGELGFLNLRTVQNTFLTVTSNIVQNNGTDTLTGEGLVLEVGTGSYLAADVRSNLFGGNLEEDVRTDSFLSAGNTYTSVNDQGATNFDAVYHDDTAQLDMRFSNNSGNQVSLNSDGAIFTNADFLKSIVLGSDFLTPSTFGVTHRNAALFQIDDGGNLDNPNNTFINFGMTQDIDGSFATGGFNLRGAADPMFPNIGFGPFLP